MSVDTKTTRTYSGKHNNEKNPTWGAANENLLRDDVGHGYDEKDNGRSLARRTGPSARAVSNHVCWWQAGPELDPSGLSSFIWAWGQYLDHEIDLTEALGDFAPIQIPVGDERSPLGGEIGFFRSHYDPKTGIHSPREQVNEISAYVDASNVYGSDEERADALRANDGSGKLKTSGPNGQLLPILEDLPEPRPGTANPTNATGFFVAGDVRVNEVAVLICMHTLFMREHNRRCEQISAAKSGLSDEEIYQRARRYVCALEQVITYEEFLPAILGPDALSPYNRYDDTVNAGVSNLFSTACYRLGHGMLSEDLLVEGLGSLPLRDFFWRPQFIKDNGISPILGGLSKQPMKRIDVRIVESIRSFLFHVQEGGRLLDLGALNIQRGRDHGLPDYNTCREKLGLRRRSSFDEISSDPAVNARLEVAYAGDLDGIDPWVGGLAEDPVESAAVGELIHTVLKDQFERFRDGDRFWYECDAKLAEELGELSEDLNDLRSRTLSKVIADNSGLKLQDDVFHV